MDLVEKVKAIEAVFEKLDEETSAFQQAAGLACPVGCGKCCFKPDIEATILEFLPFAFYLHQQNLAYQWYEKMKNSDSAVCLILEPMRGNAGLCSQYNHRPLICRLFGYSARTDKYGEKKLVTCQIIKTEQQDMVELTDKKIQNGLVVPVMNQFYMQLHAIDAELTRDFYPINIAITRALELTLHYYAYRS